MSTTRFKPGDRVVYVRPATVFTFDKFGPEGTEHTVTESNVLSDVEYVQVEGIVGDRAAHRFDLVEPTFAVGDTVLVARDGEPGDWPGDASLPLRLWGLAEVGVVATITDLASSYSTEGDPVFQVADANGSFYVRPCQIVQAPEVDVEAIEAETAPVPAFKIGDKVRIVNADRSGHGHAIGTEAVVQSVTGFGGPVLEIVVGGLHQYLRPSEVEAIA